jgi:uncharacterized protein YdaU (DUF1376 family)
MSKPSHIPLFVDAYLKDTTHLSTEAHGAYLLLMMAAWVREGCSLPNDERRLAACAKMSVKDWRIIAPDILELWTVEGQTIYQKRLRKEWHYVKVKSAKNKRAAAKRWDSERNANAYPNAYADAMHLGGGEGGGAGANGLAGFGSNEEEPFT